VRLLGPDGENFGVVSLSEALAKAEEIGLDLIEISPLAVPPVCRVMDHGKFLYDQKKKTKEVKAKAKTIEIKTLQVKVGTGENDLQMKAKRASEWLAEGHRIKLDLFLPGRTKYMEKDFLESRMERLLKYVTVPHRMAESPKKSTKGLTTIIEKA
jgi:translation initiation factor IF-3